MAVVSDPIVQQFLDETFRVLAEQLRDKNWDAIKDEYIAVISPILDALETAGSGADTFEYRNDAPPISIDQIQAFAVLLNNIIAELDSTSPADIPAIIALLTIRPPI